MFGVFRVLRCNKLKSSIRMNRFKKTKQPFLSANFSSKINTNMNIQQTKKKYTELCMNLPLRSLVGMQNYRKYTREITCDPFVSSCIIGTTNEILLENTPTNILKHCIRQKKNNGL